MKVSGFSFIRNAIKFDYPILESIQSILPLCDEFIIAVGRSDDNTLKLIQSINDPKIRIIETVWDQSMRQGGKVLAIETNKALKEISENSDWAFYIQGDEIIHEKYLDTIKNGMIQWKDNKQVEGLLFNYTHFYGSYDYIGDARRWYRHEIRIIKNNPDIKSYRDAQGFRMNNRKLRVKPINAWVYHYGWVKHPEFQQEKYRNFNAFYHSEDWIKNNISTMKQYDYSKIDSLKRFEESHPKVMLNRINKMNWKLNFDPEQTKLTLGLKLLHKFEKFTDWRIGEYKNYKII